MKHCCNAFSLQPLPTSITIWTNSVGSTLLAPELTPPTTTHCPCGTSAARLVPLAHAAVHPLAYDVLLSPQMKRFLSLLSPIWFLVALNFQTPSKEMHLNQGRFLPNGVCGYILKPEFMRSLSSQFDPNTLPKGPWLKKKVFHIMVRFIPGNCSQECVLCEIYVCVCANIKTH